MTTPATQPSGGAPAALEVLHNPGASRFEVTVDGLLSVCDYRLVDQVMSFTHTEVPTELAGRGIAAALVAAALAWAREHGYQVRPLCSYVAAYMRRHTATHTLLAR